MISERTALRVTDAERATKAVSGVFGMRIIYQETNRDGHPVAE
jgi:catechol 2,3-dioxygenase-like lactoylglutathione lyase family enzyme